MSQVPIAIYITPSLSVFKTTTSEGQARLLFLQQYSSVPAATAASSRFQSLLSLDHQYISPVYVVETEDRTVRVETEWCGEDLTKVAQQWTQDDCWGLLYCVTSALAYAQSLEIAHGAVLPVSIYKTEQGTYKLAGFRCPERLRTGESLWETREPFFLCPELRNAYTGLLLGQELGEIDCNPYKSDVYSLGLTLISLLSPLALYRLGDSKAISLCVSALPLHPQFQHIIRSMLETDTSNRPDWLELQEILNKMQSREEEAKSEVKAESAVTDKKKRLKIIRKQPEIAEKPANPDFPPHAKSIVKFCPRCQRQFHLNTAEAWRLDLIGSVESEPAAQYCSLPCFRPVSSAPPEDSEEPPAVDMALATLDGRDLPPREGERVRKTLVVDGIPQFYHCFRHKALLPSLAFSTSPTLLHQCPDCPGGQIEVEKLGSLDITIACNSHYPSLVFVQKLLPISKSNLAIRAYLPVDVSLKAALLRATCHICGNSIPRDTWTCYFHGQRAELVCSSVCLLRGTRTSTCPTCGETHGLEGGVISQERAEMAEKRVSILDPNSCVVCLLNPSDWILPCGCHVCVSCLTLIPNHQDMEEFSCLRCGTILRKDENRDLLEMLGWA